jgi:hypothetical protein
MSYSATVFRVMVASPGDVEQERRIAREVIYDWNSLHSAKTGIILEPIGWETHASPQMGDRPQAIINKQMLKNTDLLIVIFWTRIGTPTGEAESGTVEEIEEHIKEGKPVMIYFSKQPALLESVDQGQYQKLKVFIDKCKSKGLLFEYDSLSQFREYLYRHLVQTVNDNAYFEIAGESNKITIEKEQFDSVTNRVTLSKEAQRLLIEAAKSEDGTILKIRTMQGLIVQANDKNYVRENDPRSEAIWEDALKQLEENSFVEDRGYKGEVFSITRKGFDYADKLMKENPHEE